VQDKLQKDLAIANVRNSFAIVAEDKEEYSLFFNIDSDIWNAARIRYNFRTGEFAYNEYDGHEFVAGAYFRYSNVQLERVVASTTDLVWELDTDDIDDNGTQVDRSWETDWLNYNNPNPKVFKGAHLVFRKARNCRVKIGVAVDRDNKFLFEKSFDLKGTPPAKGRDPESDTVIDYKIGEEFVGTEFNVRIKMYHYSTTEAELISGHILWDRESAETDKVGEEVGTVLG
jgi:hypothetical protein